MIIRRKFAVGAVLAVVGVALAGGVASPAAAQDAAAPQAERPMHHGHAPGRHIEGRIAFLKAELKITEAQQAQFDVVAAVMRENAQAMRQTFEAMRGNGDTPPNAVQRLEMRARLAAAATE